MNTRFIATINTVEYTRDGTDKIVSISFYADSSGPNKGTSKHSFRGPSLDELLKEIEDKGIERLEGSQCHIALGGKSGDSRKFRGLVPAAAPVETPPVGALSSVLF